MSLDPGLLNARLYLATAYAQQYIPGADTEDNNKMGQQAIDEYKSVLERDPKNINSVKGIAYLYLQMKKFEDALKSYDRALLINPGYAQGHYNRGIVLQQLRRLHEALASYDCALAVEPEYTEAHINRANTLHQLDASVISFASGPTWPEC